MKKKEKKKKSLFRRILKWTGIMLLLLIIALILIPILFKDQIKEMVLKEASKQLLADLSLEDFDLTFFSTFPNLSIKLYNTKLTGRDEFEGVELVNVKEFTAQVGLWDVIGGDQISIDAIYLEEPKIDVRILQDGRANYDIVKPDSLKTEEEVSEPSNFKLSLQEYSISNGTIYYTDEAGNMKAEIVNVDHEGNGDLTESVVDFKTKTRIEKLSYEMDGISYLTDVKTEADVKLLLEMTEKTMKFTLRENEVALNALKFSVDGFYGMMEGYDDMDLKLNASKTSFKDLLSLIPAFYRTGYESMVTSGDLSLKGEVKGKMDDVNMPGWDFGMKVSNASIRYPDLPGKITNIGVDASSTFAGGADLDKMTLDVSRFHSEFVGNLLDATLKMRNPMTDPLIDSKIMAKVDLATLGQIMPLAEGESYNGKLDANVVLNGRLSALESEQYEKFKADGLLTLTDMLYKSPDLPDPVDIKNMVFRFSPQMLALENLQAKMGRSDFKMSGNIDNYLGYFFREELLKGSFNLNSQLIDLDQLMAVAPAEEGTSSESTPDTGSEAAEPILIPANVDFDLNTSINTVRYNGMDIKNVQGKIKVKDEVASLDNLSMNTMGGTVALRGDYNTKDHRKPAVDFGYDLRDLDISELAKNFITIEKLAPIAKFANGRISSSFNMKTLLQPSLEPIYSTLTGGGTLSSNSISISGFKPLEKIGDALKIDQIKEQTLKNVNARFRFEDGKVAVNPFDINLGKIGTTVWGTTSFEQDMDYDLQMNIPKDQIPAAMIKLVEDQVKKVNNVAKLDLKLIPDVVKINVDVTGKVSDPKVSTDFKEQLLDATGNLKDALIDAGKEKLNEVKDSVKNIVNDKVDDVKEDLEAKKQKILADAQKKADQIKAAGKKSAADIRKAADEQAKKLIDEAGSNPLKKRAAELTADKIRKEADEKADKVEAEANQKADDLMKKAREEADKLK